MIGKFENTILQYFEARLTNSKKFKYLRSRKLKEICKAIGAHYGNFVDFDKIAASTFAPRRPIKRYEFGKIKCIKYLKHTLSSDLILVITQFVEKIAL